MLKNNSNIYTRVNINIFIKKNQKKLFNYLQVCYYSPFND
jgi:hypothetical protein